MEPLIHPTARIHPSAYVADGVRIGANTYIGPFARIGLPAEYRDYRRKESGRVVIGDNCTITGGSCIDSGREGYTLIANGVMVMSNVHIGHDCDIQQDATIAPGAVLGGFTKIGTECWIGINAALHQHSVVPFRCVIGAGAVLTKKHWGTLEPGQAYAGNPARWIGPNKKWKA